MKKLLPLFILAPMMSLTAGIAGGSDIFPQGDRSQIFPAHRGMGTSTAQRILFSGAGRDWDKNEMTGSGFFFNLGVFLPDPSYLNPSFGSNDLRYNIGNDAELGNFFRFTSFADNMIGLGIRATWLQVGYTTASYGDELYRALQISLLRAGPQVSFGMTEKTAIDVFYQIGVNYTMDLWQWQQWTSSDHYIGASHEVGAAFRFKIFAVGLGYRFGNLSHIVSTDNDPDNEELELSPVKAPIDNLRVFVGLKF